MNRLLYVGMVSALIWAANTYGGEPLAGTRPLEVSGDLAAQMVAGIDRFLDRELTAAAEKRESYWHRDFASAGAYAESVASNRSRFGRIIGVVDPRRSPVELELIASLDQPSLIASGAGYAVHAVRWTVLDGVDAEGLLLQPDGAPVLRVVALPDADCTPEMFVGLAPGLAPELQFARRLAEYGCQVLIPTLIDRSDTYSGNPAIRMTNQPHREFVYRMAFEMGRHVIGYEVQKVLAAVDWFEAQNRGGPAQAPKICVAGYGEGGLLALSAAALDSRIRATLVSGYFARRENVWQEPIYRNAWGLLSQFGDAEIAGLIAPRALVVEASRGPRIAGPPPVREGRKGAAPGKLVSPPIESVRSEVERARGIYDKLGVGERLQLVLSGDGQGPAGSEAALTAFLKAAGWDEPLKAIGAVPKDVRKKSDPAARLRRQFDQLCEHVQRLVRESADRRAFHWLKASFSSLEEWQQRCEPYRKYFGEEVIGRFPPPSVPANARTRLAYDTPKWRGYELVLDVWPDVFAYGILLVPKDLKDGERRPVVVCQHGLEGRPQMVVDATQDSPYKAFGAQLADRGFVVYAPQNPYIGDDTFRMLQRKANPIGRSLFSVIVGQHERLLGWLGGLPFVDAKRIGLYGLSYGGKTAMRVPALLDDYCLSICSGDFNEWIVKMTTLSHPTTYMFTQEWEMPEFDLGDNFNYAEIAGLIAPRPFMVERGHSDPVATDEWVGWEYAKVQRLYAKLGIPERTEIEFFNGRHIIYGNKTFDFLHKHLNWPAR